MLPFWACRCGVHSIDKGVTKFFHFFFPTPALPVSGSMGLISAAVTVTAAPQGYNAVNITLFSELVKCCAQKKEVLQNLMFLRHSLFSLK